jgi:copper chaperone CopZ
MQLINSRCVHPAQSKLLNFTPMTSTMFKKFVFSLLLVLTSVALHAQFTKASLGINGLTCSQCSRSVEMQLRKLPFVKDVVMDLEQTQGTIIFRENKKVNIEAIARAVRDAGFSVRFVKAEVELSKINLSPTDCFMLDGNSYTILNLKGKAQAPLLRLQFIGKGYMPGNESKAYSIPLNTACKGKTNYFAIAE